jgi:putative transposase
MKFSSDKNPFLRNNILQTSTIFLYLSLSNAVISYNMSYVRIWVHCVWTTKNKIPYLKDQIREKVIEHIRENVKSKDIYIDHINGYYDHLHVILSLGGKQNTSDIMQKIKGESSYWINKNKLTRLRFEWQDDYYAVSIGMNQLDNLRKYIRNQVQHHQKISLQDELNKLIEEYKLEKMAD